MLSVRKEELLSDGLIGIVSVLVSVMDWFTNKELLACILLAFIVVIYVAVYIYQARAKKEPWDELTRENYANARRITLLFVEITLLIWAIICLAGHFQVTLKASHILFYYGMVKLVQTGAFLCYDAGVGK